jgi:hypothetical protein
MKSMGHPYYLARISAILRLISMWGDYKIELSSSDKQIY